MHTALALQLAPVLAAEKSKVPFYVAGGVLVLWALFASLGLGLRRPGFPGTVQAERAMIAVTVVLVLAAVSTAVITSGSSAKAGTPAGSSTQSSESAAQPSAPSTSSSTSTPATTQTQASTGTATAPKAKAPAAAKPAPAATTALALVANPAGQLSYDTKTLSAKAGTVTITLRNNAPLEHNVTIAQGSKVLGATPSFIAGSRKLTLRLSPGTYVFYCSVPGHRQAGMEGTLKIS
ncbi:MAG TPA: plastocyanin/azurin family copper-binding protein [Solirubrobacteraceae bacterium]|jgi:plastocyanin